MKILPYQNEHFSEYRTKSVQEFRFELSQGIRSQIFFAIFVKNTPLYNFFIKKYRTGLSDV